MQLSESVFTGSSISVRENVVKNVLFRVSSITLQYSIFNFCAYIAYLSTEYTSFLMFAEDYVQRALFIASRGTNRSAIIVLVFTISYTLANLYDSLLWAVDSPGCVKRSKLADGNTVSPFLLQNPSYVTIVNNLGHDLDRVDVNQSLTSNLFTPGFNFSFPPVENARSPQAIMPPKPMDPVIGPRIFLDTEGFSLTLNDILLGAVVDGRPCLGNDGGNETTFFWYCSFTNSDGDSLLKQTAGLLWARWSDVVSTPVNFERSDNPWTSYSSYGDTGVMKQVVTFTKGNKRHTFLHTVSKVSMLSKEVFPDEEIQTMLRRIYAPDGETDSLHLADRYAQRCLETQTNGLNSSSMGFTV